MTHEFDRAYWEQHWREARGDAREAGASRAANPYLARELSDLVPGRALDAGCGEGAEAMWLASQGWRVTGADISAVALSRAADRAEHAGLSERLTWVEADLTVWEPAEPYDLVVTSYAHPTMPQLAFYDRVAGWVAPGGTLLIVGHLHEAAPDDATAPEHGAGRAHEAHAHEAHAHEAHAQEAAHAHEPPHPAAATVTLSDITARLDDETWQIDTAEEHTRTPHGHGDHVAPLRDVVVRATRRS